MSSSVLGGLKNQGARADESDFTLKNISQTSDDDFRKRPNDLDSQPIYLSNQPITSQTDSGSKILTLSNPFRQILLQPQERDQPSQAQKDLQSKKLTEAPEEYFEKELTKKIAEELAKKADSKSPITISSTPQNLNQDHTPSNAIATATLGFATQSSSSDSDSPAQQQKPSNSPLIQPQPNQLPSTTASQGAELNSSNPLLRNTQSSQTASCFTRLLTRCASPATHDQSS